ncbi:unnamed protein product [Kluyveromyces dobzhanskii CBS 2104]|uniref:WGS project CCBQ000000000 data, contig 00272 n=1 Tax=Kluyveromyces dobzhanskii CBS 2104 TaxID=1427455 RepID=A0A0A8L8C5_9SACH|nr:unnamed protein product [Kluyveromyces dobzhanskii CBS 2104]
MLQLGGSSVPAHKGVVHGHIHNYNNLTYIHGHIHKNDAEDGAVSGTDDALNCAQYQDCEHFEFINCHSLNLFGENGNASAKQAAAAAAGPGSSHQQVQQQQPREQRGPPRLVDITCDDKNEPVPSSLSNALDFLNCHLTCDSPDMAEEDKENVCDEDGQDSLAEDERKTRDKLDGILNNDGPSSSSRGDSPPSQQLHLPNNTNSVNFNNSSMKLENANLDNQFVKNDTGNSHTDVDHLNTGFSSSLNIGVKEKPDNSQLDTEMRDFFDSSRNVSKSSGTTSEPPFVVNSSPVNAMDIGLKYIDNHSLVEAEPLVKDEQLQSSKQQNVGIENNEDDKDTSVEDQLFENLCSQCAVNYELMETPHFHHNSHSHIINTSTDMKVLKDLSSISSLYEQIGKHEHTHENLYEDKNNSQYHHDHDSMNLLHYTLNGYHGYSHTENLPAQVPQQLNGSGNDCGNVDSNGRVVSSEQQQQDNNQYTVDDCCQDCADDDQEYQELLVHPQAMGSDLDGNLTSNTINFNWSFNTTDAPIYCRWDDCLQPYENLFDLQSHVLKEHVALDQFKALSCKWQDCDFNTTDPCSMVNHVNGKHGINFDVNVLDSETMARQASFHKQLHEEPQSFVCKWGGCSKVFDSAKLLNEHIENFHVPSGLSSYKCEWEGCNKSFVQKQKLIRHLKVHSKYKPFKCAECGKCFNTQDILTQHLRVHSGERPFKCHLCSKSYSTSSSLRIHIRTHTGEKPLSCPICNKRFNESSNLAKHIRTHKRENCTSSKKL